MFFSVYVMLILFPYYSHRKWRKWWYILLLCKDYFNLYIGLFFPKFSVSHVHLHSCPYYSSILSPGLFLYSSVCQPFSHWEAAQMEFLTSSAEVHRILSLALSRPALHSSQREEKFGFPGADLRNGSASRFLCGWIWGKQGRQALTQGGYCQNKHIGTLARLGFSLLFLLQLFPHLSHSGISWAACAKRNKETLYCTRNALTEEQQWRHEAGEASNMQKSQIPRNWHNKFMWYFVGLSLFAFHHTVVLWEVVMRGS